MNWKLISASFLIKIETWWNVYSRLSCLVHSGELVINIHPLSSFNKIINAPWMLLWEGCCKSAWIKKDRACFLDPPWWPASVTLQPLAGQRRSPPAPPWPRCGGGCSRWWWQHLDGPCVAAAAAQSLFFPDGTQCGGESGPPEDDTVEEEWHLGDAKTTALSWHATLGNSHLTRALASTIAPFLSRHLTTSTWPALAAICNAVSPRCRHNTQQRADQISQQTHVQLKYSLI